MALNKTLGLTIISVLLISVATLPIAGKAAGDWPTFQGDAARRGSSEASPVSNPRALWKTKVGVQSWLNNPVIAGGKIYVGTCGQKWNEPDAGDGVYCLDFDSGSAVWFRPARADVNGVAFADGLVVATGDEGAVWALDAPTGKIRWRRIGRGQKMYTNPLIINGLVVTGDSEGFLYGLDLRSGKSRWAVKMNGAIRGGASSDGESIFAVTAKGEVARIGLDGGLRWKRRLSYLGYGEVDLQEGAGFAAESYPAPTVAARYLIIPFARDTYYDEPALFALDKTTGALIWAASDPNDAMDSHGNLRGSPAVYKGLLVYGEPYSNNLVQMGLIDGKVRSAAAMGLCMFPHYPSPAIAGNIAILPRHDGGLYAWDLEANRLAWKLYIGEAAIAGDRFPETLPDGGYDCSWQPPTGGSIYSSPAIGPDGSIVVGTEEGYLYRVGG